MASKIRVKKKESKVEQKISKNRISDILNVIFAYAQLNFKMKASVKGDESYMDAVATGINMLGEELQSSTVSLKEKEVLIREIHHRVKNNLAIISSLINIQSAKARDKYHKQLFNDCRNRLLSIAYIHQQLYFTNDYSKLDFAAYISDIINMIESTYSHEKVKISTDLQPVILNIDKAIPCSLILNELVTNCYKHAFKGMKSGKIISIVLKNKKGISELTVKDNGKGISVTKKEKESMGMSLINDLVHQLDGEIKWKNKSGTEARVKFNT